MTKRDRILLYRSSGEQKPSADDITHGELAVGYAAGKEKLYLKNTDDQIASFISEEQVDSKIDSVKHLDVEFTVTPNEISTSETISFSVTHNGEPATPSATTITKTSNDGEPTYIFSGTSQSSTAFTISIEGAKEYYEITVYPNSESGTITKKGIHKYMTYIGTSTADSINGDVLDSFWKSVSDSTTIEKTVTTKHGEFVWIVIPDSLQITNVTDSGMPFSLNEPIPITDTVTVADITNHISIGESKPWIDYNKYIKTSESVNNPEFVEAVLDSEDRLLYGKRIDGTEYTAAGDYVLDNNAGTMKAYRSKEKLADADWNLIINAKLKN